MSVPETAANDTLAIIRDLPRDVTSSHFAVGQVKRSIDKIRAVNAGSAYMLEGTLQSALRNETSSIEAHEKSLRINRYEHQYQWNYYVSMTKLHNHAKAQEVLTSMASLGIFSEQFAYALIAKSLFLLDSEAIHKFKDISLNYLQSQFKREVVMDLISQAKVYDKFVESSPSLKRDADKVVSHVVSTLKNSALTSAGTIVSKSFFHKQPVLHLSYHVVGDIDEIIIANEQLVNAITEDESIDNWDSVVASFVPVEKDKVVEAV